MKRTLILLFIGLSSLQSLYAQFDSKESEQIEKNLYSFQPLLGGIWVNRETRIGDQLSLRQEIGFEAYFYGRQFRNRTLYELTPDITLEPRWYYNFKKRVKKGKHTSKNSADYLALRINYQPGWFMITNDSPTPQLPELHIIPMIGLRRTYFDHLTFELGMGHGLEFLLPNKFNIRDKPHFEPHFILRLGYTFGK